MARHKSTAMPAAPVNDAYLAEITSAQNALSAQAAEIEAQFGDGLVYNLALYLDKCRYHMGRSAEEALEAGRCLIIMKARESHGSFGKCLATLGLDDRLARRMMQATIKYSKLSSKKLLEAANSKTKLFELMVLDDEELKELNDGGTVAGLTLDDIDRMSSSELRAALREAREDVGAKERQLADKDSKINTLDRKLKKRLKEMTPDREAEELRKEISNVAFEIQAMVMGTLRQGFEKLTENTTTSEIDHEAFMAGCCAQIERELIMVRGRYNIKAKPEADPTPEWVNWDEKGLEAQTREAEARRERERQALLTEGA